MRRTAVLLACLLPALAHAQRIEHQPGKLTGVVVAAPHAGFDTDSDKLLRLVVDGSGIGWVVAHDYRKLAQNRFFNVNRPTEHPVSAGRRGPEQATERAAAVYRRYRDALFAAGRTPRGPLRLLVEIHGQGARPVIELASTGFEPARLAALKARYAALAREAGLAAPVPLHCWPLERSYRHDGRELRFRFTAAGARRRGSLQPSVARRGLHLELPGPPRKDPVLRRRYAVVLRGLIEEALRAP